MRCLILVILGCFCTIASGDTAARRFENRLQFKADQVVSVCLSMASSGKAMPREGLIAHLTQSAQTAVELVASIENAFKIAYKKSDSRKNIQLRDVQDELERDALAYVKATNEEQKMFLLTLLREYPGMWHEAEAIYAAMDAKK